MQHWTWLSSLAAASLIAAGAMPEASAQILLTITDLELRIPNIYSFSRGQEQTTGTARFSDLSSKIPSASFSIIQRYTNLQSASICCATNLQDPPGRSSLNRK